MDSIWSELQSYANICSALMNPSPNAGACDTQHDFAGAEPFGQRIRKAREQLGTSQAEIASQAGMAPSYLSSIERGRRPAPTVAVVLRLIKALALDDEEATTLTAAAAQSRDAWHHATDKSFTHQGDAGTSDQQRMSVCLSQAFDAMRRGWCAGFEVIFPVDGQPVRVVITGTLQTQRAEATM